MQHRFRERVIEMSLLDKIVNDIGEILVDVRASSNSK